MLNKVMFIGRLTRNPELKTVGSGKSVTTFGLALNRKYKDAHGDLQEDVTFVDIVCWDKLAENVAKYQTKGKRVYVEGRLQIDAVDGEDGRKKYFTKIVAYTVLFLDNREDSERAKPVYGDNVPYKGNEEVPF